MVLFLISFINGADCLDLEFTVVNEDVTDNSSFGLKLKSFAGHPGDFWGIYQNTTLTYDNSKFTNLGSDFFDFSEIPNDNTHTWLINASIVGNFLFNVSVINSSDEVCNMNLSVNVLPSVIVPNVTSSFRNFENVMVVGDNYTFSLVLNNSGYGDAHNVSGFLRSLENLTLSSSNFSLDKISNRSERLIDYTMNSIVCGGNSLEVIGHSYNDSVGEIMLPVEMIRESFNVVGSEIDVLESTFTFIKTGTKPVTSVTFNVSVKNIGELNSTNSSIKFYYDSYSKLISEVLIGDMSINETKNVSFVWNSPSSGNHVIKTEVASLNECPSLNREDMGSVVSIPSTSSGGSSGGGGGSSGNEVIEEVDLDLDEINSSDNELNDTNNLNLTDDTASDNESNEDLDLDFDENELSDIFNLNVSNNTNDNENSSTSSFGGNMLKGQSFFIGLIFVIGLLIWIGISIFKRKKIFKE